MPMLQVGVACNTFSGGRAVLVLMFMVCDLFSPSGHGVHLRNPSRALRGFRGSPCRSSPLSCRQILLRTRDRLRAKYFSTALSDLVRDSVERADPIAQCNHDCIPRERRNAPEVMPIGCWTVAVRPTINQCIARLV